MSQHHHPHPTTGRKPALQRREPRENAPPARTVSDAPLPPPDDPRLHHAHDDAEAGLPDTDRGTVMDRLYHRVRKGTQGAPR